MTIEEEFKASLAALAGPGFDGKRYVVAVSGGRDSMVLLHLMRKAGARLAIAHMNHKLRGEASDEDERLVRETARRMGIPVTVGSATTPERSEEKLRATRLRFLEEARAAFEADFIVTAHHLDDALETFLMRFIRGTGIDGLSGIPKKRGRIIRPLLDIERDRITHYAVSAGIAFRDDETNAREDYFRNRVRKRLLPELFELANEFGGKRRFLARTCNLLCEISEVKRDLSKRSSKLYRRHAVETAFWTRLSFESLEALGPSRRRVLRQLFRRLGMESLSREKLLETEEALLHLRKKLSLPGGVIAIRSCGHIFFQSPSQKERLSRARLMRQVEDGFEAPALGLRLKLTKGARHLGTARFPEPGDRLGSKKLKRIFLERRVPAPERALVPLMASGASVSWLFPDAVNGIEVTGPAFPFSFLPPQD